jgi:hypothetical protein
VVQTSWFPGVEAHAAFSLVGPGYRLDADKKRTIGPLVAKGVDTGVDIEVRAGGPAIGFQHASAQMYLDKTITLAEVSTDASILDSVKLPTIGVVAPFDLDPQIIMWSPDKHPDWNIIADIGQTNEKVLYFDGEPYMQYLIGAGILRQSQVDGNWDGGPSRFVASGGTVAQQGYVTYEPFVWSQETKNWNKPIDYALVHDSGYVNYPDATLAIRAGDKGTLAPCLKKLVPIIQRAQVDFMKDPAPAIKVVLDANKAYGKGWFYSSDVAANSVQKMREEGLVGNGTYTPKTSDDFDPARIKRMIEILTPIAHTQGVDLKPGLKPEDLFTNEFIDRSIGLSPAQ